jgi:prepilin-type N-terminal cleavage/methylation domain-containing protein
MERKGFTLIELLVVIGIVALLAAILFPVFAQVKDAARDTTTLSNVKQIGLAAMAYTGDFDDALPLAWRDTPGQPGMGTWQGAVQPYCKNWDLFVHPKLQRPEGDGAYWERLQYFGALPKVETHAREDGTIYHSNLGRLTGYKDVLSVGLLGSYTRGMYGYRQGQFPSAILSSIDNASDELLFTEAGNWDMLVGTYDTSQPFSFCSVNGTWGPGMSPYAGQYVYAGPHAHKRPQSGYSGVGDGCRVPDGQTTFVAADGSAHAMDFRGRILERVARPDGLYVFKRFWPQGL